MVLHYVRVSHRHQALNFFDQMDKFESGSQVSLEAKDSLMHQLSKDGWKVTNGPSENRNSLWGDGVVLGEMTEGKSS